MPQLHQALLRSAGRLGGTGPGAGNPAAEGADEMPSRGPCSLYIPTPGTVSPSHLPQPLQDGSDTRKGNQKGSPLGSPSPLGLDHPHFDLPHNRAHDQALSSNQRSTKHTTDTVVSFFVLLKKQTNNSDKSGRGLGVVMPQREA